MGLRGRAALAGSLGAHAATAVLLALAAGRDPARPVPAQVQITRIERSAPVATVDPLASLQNPAPSPDSLEARVRAPEVAPAPGLMTPRSVMTPRSARSAVEGGRAMSRRPSARPPAPAGKTPARETDGAASASAGAAATPPRKDYSALDLTVHARTTAPVPTIGIAIDGGAARRGGDAGRVDLEDSGDGTYQHVDHMYEAHVARDGRVEFGGRFPDVGVGPDARGRLSGRIGFDVTDALMGAAGQDPYGYEKQKFMVATRAFRQEMYDATCKEDLAASVLSIRSQLEEIWNDPQASLARRHELIFQLWDQCAEDGSAAVRKTSAQIRAIIVDFIHERMPVRGEYCYTPADLDALNRRRHSRQLFAPYGDDDANPMIR